VGTVGVLHTIVPDHWVPITVIARQQGWSKGETARAALQAGTGHVVSTLLIAAIVWIAGVAVAARLGHYVSIISSIALIGFGGWIALSSWAELRKGAGHGYAHGVRFQDHSGHVDHLEDHGHGHDDKHDDEFEDPLFLPARGGTAAMTRHVHLHRHGAGSPHLHLHEHIPDTAHEIASDAVQAPLHEHAHKRSLKTALLIILGSSPMIEGIPAFFSASRYGVGLLAVMAVVFGIATIATYVVLCVYSAEGLQRVRLGSFEKYGEVISGAFIAIIGIVFLIWPVL